MFGLYGASMLGTPYPSTFGGFNPGVLGVVMVLVVVFGLFTGALIIVGGTLLNSETAGRRKSGGILAICMMVIGAIPTLGGIGIGFILTLVGGVLGMTYKERFPGTSFRGAPAAVVPSAAQPDSGPGQKFCVRCGSPHQFGAQFCGNCGTGVVQG